LRERRRFAALAAFAGRFGAINLLLDMAILS
jgi:hypothetical protein